MKMKKTHLMKRKNKQWWKLATHFFGIPNTAYDKIWTVYLWLAEKPKANSMTISNSVEPIVEYMLKETNLTKKVFFFYFPLEIKLFSVFILWTRKKFSISIWFDFVWISFCLALDQ